MFSLREIFRFAQTLAVPLILGLVVQYVVPKGDKDAVAPSLYIPILTDIGFVPREFPVSYRAHESDLAFKRIQNVSSSVPDTTAVVLNWSRFPNVLLITSLLCGEWLDDVIDEVLIWNNNPRPLTYEDLKNTGCPKKKLTIRNSPANLYFQGRFVGCAESRNKYCFVQDDDYLVRAEIIRALHSRMTESDRSRGIFLTPPHEHLTSRLREIHVPKADPSYQSDIHTSFAWLGYGSIILRSEAISFISLLRRIRASGDEMQMADNFFTILSNEVPEIWFDEEFELGGGQPFTVGAEGEERNKHYIMKATEYLESITHCNAPSCTAEAETKATRSKLPHVSFESHPLPSPWQRAVCKGSSCVLDTNIRLVPEDIGRTSASNMLALEQHNLVVLGKSRAQHYVDFALSKAVDTNPHTAFISPENAAAGDVISLDALADVGAAQEWIQVEIAWLVTPEAETILRASRFEWSSDGRSWHQVSQELTCCDSDMESLGHTDSAASAPRHLRECGILMSPKSSDSRASGRYFRASLEEDQQTPWAVHEVWLRGTRADSSANAGDHTSPESDPHAHVEL